MTEVNPSKKYRMQAQLYAISPPQFDLSEFPVQLKAALETGKLACFQLRLKESNVEDIISAIQALMPLCHQYEVPFILNDEIELAVELETDGVHLGQEDLAHRSIKEIRKQLTNDQVLGITCHASLHLAMEAGEQGADYVAFGAFYDTRSKPKEKLEKWGRPDVELLHGWTQFSTLPCVAIGGITPQNLTPLVAAGADFVAAITGIWNHPQGAAAGVLAYDQAIQEALAAA